MSSWVLTGLLLVAAGAAAPYHAAAAEPWQPLEPGLDLALFDSSRRQASAGGDLVVLRVDPELWDLRVLSCAPEDRGKGFDIWKWCREYGLVAAVNAGMFQADHRTHVGYCKIDGEVTNRYANDYLSAAAFDPVDPADAPFRIFDLDEVELGEVAARYRTVVQNLRLIKRAGENRWQSDEARWREAALAEDYKGRCLLIYCDRSLSMYEFNELLLALPLGVVAAQHLEGSGPAKLWIDHDLVDLDALPRGHKPGPVLPNVLGVARRHPQDSLGSDTR